MQFLKKPISWSRASDLALTIRAKLFCYSDHKRFLTPLVQGSPSGGGGGSKGGDKLLCPKCGAPCEHVATFITSTRWAGRGPIIGFVQLELVKGS